MIALKSADHVQAILALINVGTWATDAIWQANKDILEYRFVPLPDRSYNNGRGWLVIEQGRQGMEPTGNKQYPDEATFWKTMLKHWPRPPFKKTQWTRDYRQKDGDAIERGFVLFAHNIYAVTREVAGEIVSIEFTIKMGWDETTQSYPRTVIHTWTK